MAHLLLCTDRSATVLRTLSFVGASRRDAYQPFGNGGRVAPALAFNGQWREPRHGAYLLGHGQRAYLPALRRFCQADTLSPFAQGGRNGYAYCHAEPINRLDPSGHSIVGLVGNIFGTANLAAYGGLMATGYRLGAPSRAVLATDVALMAAGVVSQAVAWATQSEVASIVGVAATGITALGRGMLAVQLGTQRANPGKGFWAQPAWGKGSATAPEVELTAYGNRRIAQFSDMNPPASAVRSIRRQSIT